MLEYYKKNKMIKTLAAQLPDDVEQVKHSIQNLLEADSADVHALMVLARCHLLCNESNKAKRTLEVMIKMDPGHVFANVELARVLYAQEDVQGAIEHLSRVTNARPELAENWQLLGEYLHHDGQLSAAKKATDQYDMIKAYNDNLHLAEQAFACNEFVKADNMCRQLLELVPDEPRALRLLARLARHFRHYEISTSILARCIEIKPADHVIGLDYAKSLLANHRYQDAFEKCQQLIEQVPEVIETYGVKAEVLYNLGQYAEAIAIYRDLSALPECRSNYLLLLGKLLTTVGNTTEAIDCFHQVIEHVSIPGHAYWELASLKTYRFSEDEIESMRAVLDSGGISAMNKLLVQFALGKALEDEHQFSESFEHYHAANRAYGKIRRFRYRRQNARFKSVFTTDYFQRQPSDGNQSCAPIFVLGLPRSGSTLVEQILTSHSQVDATMELPEITSIARELNVSSLPGQGEYPESVAKLGEYQVQEFARRYLNFAQPLRQQAAHFVDKLPGNFQHIGLIKTLFPNAKIIDIRRHPMASGWSIYKHFFADSFLFSYDLTNIGKYYNDYIELMDHWHAVLPGQILTIVYEDLINDTSMTVERLLNYCELEFENACIDFHLNQRAVATPSSEQVRQPIYKNALEQWRNFEDFLTPLRQVIRDTDNLPGTP